MGPYEKKLNDLAGENANLKASLAQLQGQANNIKQDVLTTIQNGGLRIGNRWLIREEGTNSYEALIFRDMKNVGDCRYAFWAGKFRNP